MKNWKPIHLCWWFEKHNFRIPKYLIGKKTGSNPPSVSTEACTDTTTTTTTGNGTVINTGTAAQVVERGFYYMEGVGNPTAADLTVYETGLFNAEAFSLPITELTPETEYSVRAFAISGYGTGYGISVQVTTDVYIPPEPPTQTAQRLTMRSHKRLFGKPR